MGKTFEDLATDKPEDIAEELKKRAADREPPIEEPDEDTVDTANSDDDGPDDTDKPKDEPEDIDEDEGGDDEPDPLLAELEAQGIGQFKTREAALKTFKELRTKLSQRDDEAILGRHLLDSGVSPEDVQRLLSRQPTPGATPKPTTNGWSPPHEWDPSWDDLVTATQGEDGEIDYKGPAEIVRKIKENEAYTKRWTREFMRNPVDALMKAGLPDRLREIARAELQSTEGEKQYRSYMEENGEFIDENREALEQLVAEGWPAKSAVEHLKLQRKVEALEHDKEPKTAKKRDLNKATRKTRRAGAKAGGKTAAIRELAKLPTKEALKIRLAEMDEVIPETF